MFSRYGTFIINANLTYFVDEEKYFDYTVSELQKFCDIISANAVLLNSTSNCSTTMEILHSSLKEIKENSINNVWINIKSTSVNKMSRSHRKKRELSSTFAKLLFEAASNERGTDQVNVLKLQTVENLLLIDKHTTLFEGLLDVVNNTMQFQNGLHTTLQYNFSNLTLWLDSTSNKTISTLESHELYTKFIELGFIIMFSILEFRESQRKLFEAITTKSGLFQLIPPRIFEKKLSEITLSDDTKDFHLPMALRGENLPKFYEITTTESEIVNNTFVVRFSVPLVENRIFVLHKVASIPYRNATNDLYNFIVPRHEFIAIDTFNATFVTLSADNVKKCHRINGTNLLCYLNSPINMVNNDLGCEINLLLNKNVTSNCEFRTERLIEEFWMKLEQPNTYLYTVPKIVPIEIQCSQLNETQFLRNSGIISLKPGCKIRTDRVELITFHSIESNFAHNFSSAPKINVSSEIASITRIEVSPIPSFKLLNNTSDQDWIKVEEIKHNLEVEIGIAIDAAEKVLSSVVNSNKSVNEIVLTLAMIVIAIAVIYTCIKYSLTTGISVLIFMILVGLATTGILYFI